MAATLLVKTNATEEQIIKALKYIAKAEVVKEGDAYRIKSEYHTHLDSYAYYQCLDSEYMEKWVKDSLIYSGMRDLVFDVIERSQTEYYTALDGRVIVGKSNYDVSYP